MVSRTIRGKAYCLAPQNTVHTDTHDHDSKNLVSLRLGALCTWITPFLRSHLSWHLMRHFRWPKSWTVLKDGVGPSSLSQFQQSGPFTSFYLTNHLFLAAWTIVHDKKYLRGFLFPFLAAHAMLTPVDGLPKNTNFYLHKKLANNWPIL